jgi:O-antigen/teichoic acid export membrane protein
MLRGPPRPYRSRIDDSDTDTDGLAQAHARRVGAGAIIGLAGGILSFVLATAYQIIVARKLGPAGFGVLALALAIASFLAEGADLGLDYGVLRFGGIARSNGEPGVLRTIVGRSLRGTLLVGGVAGIALAAASTLVAALFNKPELAPVLIPMALTAPFTASTEVARAALRTLGRAARPVASSSLIGPGLRLVAAVVALTIAPSATAVAWGYLTSEVLLFAATSLMLWQLLPANDGSDFSNRRLLRFSLPMSLNRMLLYSNNQTEILFLGFFGTSADTGIFGVARRLSLLVGSALLTAFSVLFDPLVSGLHHAGRTRDLDAIFKTTTRWMFTLALPLCLSEMIFAKDIMHVFGQAFEKGAPVLAILAAGQLINVGTGITSNLQAMAGYAKITLFNSLLFLGLSVVLDLLLIPTFGIVGAAIANSTAVVTVNLLRLVQIKRRLGVVPYDWSYWRPVVAVVPAALISVFLPLPAMQNVIELLVRMVVLGIVYLAVLWMLGISELDREVMRSAFKRIRRKRSRSSTPSS